MAFLSFGYRISSEANLFVQPPGPVTEGVFRVLFAGWTSYIFEDRRGELKMCGEFTEAQTELLRLYSLAIGNKGDNVELDPQSLAEGSTQSYKVLERQGSGNLYGWDSLQGFLSPEGDVVALFLSENTVSSPVDTPRPVFANALDVASCGLSTDYHTVAIDRQTGGLFRWTLSDPVPRHYQRSTKFTRVWAGEAHFLALDKDGTLYSWGSGRHGQLGNGDLVSKTSPEPVEPLEGIRIVDAACGAAFSVALSDTGDVYTFGLNDHGQLGIGRAEVKRGQGQGLQQQQQERNTALPQLVDFFEDISRDDCQNQGVSQIEVFVVKVACGHSHTVVLDDEGRVWSCGWGKYGQLGQDESTTTSSSSSSSPSNLDEDNRQKKKKEKRMALLRSKGSVTMEEDRYLFRPVVKASGGRQVWSDVRCGRWSTFAWHEEGEL